MNECKCSSCNNNLVWEGDLLTGGLICATCRELEFDVSVEPPYKVGEWTKQVSANVEFYKRTAEFDPSDFCTDYLNDRGWKNEEI